jgi:hypothetical protein
MLNAKIVKEEHEAARSALLRAARFFFGLGWVGARADRGGWGEGGGVG